MEPVNESPQSPRVLGNRYEVGDLLGRGGMAEVHLGRDTRLGRVVAIKLLRTDLARDPMFQARFRREAQSAAGLNHPAIVAVYDTGEETVVESGGSTVSLPYIVMEYVEGRTLRDVLREGRPMEVQQALEVTGGVLSALDYSHRMGIVHRDIKPANVMLNANGDIKVMDFGIARALADVSATMTQTQAVIGTAQYLSPEQARGETVDARSDLYSGGCLLFELMTGRPPFIADSPVAVAYQHVREIPQPPSTFSPGIPDVVDRIVLHALAKDREARYQTAAEFRGDVEAALAGRAVSTSAATSVMPAANQGGGMSSGNTSTEYLGQAGDPNYPMTRTMQQGAVGPGIPPSGQPDGEAYSRRAERRGPGPDGYADPGGAGRKAGFAVLAVMVVVLFAGAAYGVSSLVGRNSVANASVSVPTVQGLAQKLAETQMTGSGFSAEIHTETSDKVKQGVVIRTDPPGGSTARMGSVVKIYVSAGAAMTKVPDVKGKTPAEAQTLLEKAGFKVSPATDAVPGNGVEEGLVVETQPAIGKDAPQGTEVTLKVSSGKVNVPDVVGKTKDQAIETLLAAGIKAELITVIEMPSTESKGKVIDQDPKKGSVAGLKAVSITVAMPIDQTTGGNGSGDGSGSGGDQNPGGDQSTGDQNSNGDGNDQNSNSVPGMSAPTS
ncbi:MAG: eukaryotic-like serine/threonine-protein kinase [Actinomycetota bacterium]|nr:eukaryotic-like serine/threonine-protein kinase [Actinomycetota bacterium]